MLHPWSLLSTLRRPAKLLDRVTSVHHKYLDHICASLTHNPLFFPTGFFSDGWGDIHIPSMLEKRITSRDRYSIEEIESLELSLMKQSRFKLKKNRPVAFTGHFKSTARDGDVLLPIESQRACFELVVPEEIVDRNTRLIHGKGKSLVVLLPGTGEHGCKHRRRTIAEPLAKAGISTIVLEGAFYGQRKPASQKGSKLKRVSDLPILGYTTIEETKSLLSWFKERYGYEYLVVAGGSMGGLHAAMTAALCPFDVGVASWIAPPSAVPAFTRGLLSLSCNWNSLKDRNDLMCIDHFLQSDRVLKHHPYENEGDVSSEVKKRLAAFLSVTNIDNFPSPRRPDAVIFSQASEDQYIGENEQQWELLKARWPGAKFRRVTAGHVSGILFETEAFLDTIMSSLATLKQSKDIQHS